MAVFDYLNSKGYDCNLTIITDDLEAKEWLERGYATMI